MEAKSGVGASSKTPQKCATPSDVYFSVDIESDGPIPGPYSMLSFGIVLAGEICDGAFVRAAHDAPSFYAELKPISAAFQPEAMQVNGLDRDRLLQEGHDPADAMKRAAAFIAEHACGGTPVLVAYPLSFDWSFIYWYFMRFAGESPFSHSRCFDMKTALAVKGNRPVSKSGHGNIPAHLRSTLPHTHNALDDARSQADMFAKLMEWDGK